MPASRAVAKGSLGPDDLLLQPVLESLKHGKQHPLGGPVQRDGAGVKPRTQPLLIARCRTPGAGTVAGVPTLLRASPAFIGVCAAWRTASQAGSPSPVANRYLRINAMSAWCSSALCRRPHRVQAQPVHGDVGLAP